MRCVNVTGSDDRLDCRYDFWEPVNSLPSKCSECGFPDLDFVPQPYFLVKSRTLVPNELVLAANGNFLLRERIRNVLELLAPSQCTYFPTFYNGTSQQTPWFLAVPNLQIVSGQVDSSVPRCEACGEPRSAHPGSQWCERLFRRPLHDEGDDWSLRSDSSVLKSSTWASSEKGWNKRIDRDLYISVRLLHLLKKIKAKGFYEATCQQPLAPNKEDAEWIEEKLQLLESRGVPFHPAGTLSPADAKWLKEYLRTNSGRIKSKWDIKAVEKRIHAKLPKSYVDFVTAVGTTTFENVDEQEGSSVSILSPNELNVVGDIGELDDEESKAINHLTFATTMEGDCFCFDVQKGRKEYSVYVYKHESQLLEPYAENFSACIKRFACASNG